MFSSGQDSRPDMLDFNVLNADQSETRSKKLYFFTAFSAWCSTAVCRGIPRYMQNRHIDISKPNLLSFAKKLMCVA